MTTKRNGFVDQDSVELVERSRRIRRRVLERLHAAGASHLGTNMSMVSVAAEAEARLGKPVIAINTATYWHALRACGIEDRIPGLGRLLAEF